MYLLAAVLLAALVAGVVTERLFISMGNQVGPAAGTTSALGSLSAGLYAVPLAGGSPVRHSSLFRWARQVALDAVNRKLIVMFPNSGRGSVIFDASKWTDADLANPDFAATPVAYLDVNATLIALNGGDFEFTMTDAKEPVIVFSLGVALDPAIISRSLFFAPYLDGQIAPFLQIPAEQNQVDSFMWYARIKGHGTASPLLFVTLDVLPFKPDNYSQVLAFSLPANLMGGTNLGGLVMPPPTRGGPSGGNQATMLEIDSDGTRAIVGYGGDGVVLINITNPASIQFEDILDTCPDATCTKNTTFGALSQCGRFGAPKSAIAWANTLSLNETQQQLASVQIARYAVGAQDFDALTADTIDIGGKLRACGSTWTQSGGQVVVAVNESLVLLYDAAPSPPSLLRSVASPCDDTRYIGQLGGYALFHHLYNNTCNCVPQGPCPPALQVLGNSNATVSKALGHDYLFDGRDFYESSRTLPLATFPEATLEMVVAQDGLASVKDELEKRQGCHPLSNTNMAGALCLVWRGNCTFVVKIDNCVSAGAVAIMIVNYQNRFNDLLDIPDYTMPVLIASYETGEALRAALAVVPSSTSTSGASTGTSGVPDGVVVRPPPTAYPVVCGGPNQPSSCQTTATSSSTTTASTTSTTGTSSTTSTTTGPVTDSTTTGPVKDGATALRMSVAAMAAVGSVLAMIAL